jgi:hypothetical protein
MDTAHTPTSISSALAEQHHLAGEIWHQDTEAAFEALAVRFAPAADPETAAVWQAYLDLRDTSFQHTV